MADLVGTPGTVAFTVTIKRKETGAEETYELIGPPIDAPDEPKPTEGGECP